MNWIAKLKGLRGPWNQARLIPAIVAGRFRWGIAKIVRRTVAEQLAANNMARAHRYPLAKRIMLTITGRPVLAAFAGALLYAAAAALGYFDLLPAMKLAPDDNASVRDFWDINVAILGVQAALVSLAFPLVIAFVGLLNQGRASFASRITIYIEASGALFVGISSLLLCLAVSIQLPIAGHFSDSAELLITGLNLLWLAINIAALAYFILRTIAFIHPARRTPLMFAYVANIVWPRELAAIVTQNQWGNATAYGLLPAGEEEVDIFEPGYGARTWYGRMTRVGEPRVSRTFKGKERLCDVRVGIIAPVVRRWLEDVRSSSADTQHDFLVDVEPGSTYEGEKALVRTTTPLGPISRLGLHWAFVFEKQREDHGSVQETARLLSDMLTDLIALIDTRQSGEFALQLEEVAELHQFLYSLGQKHDEDFNYSLIGSGSGLFGFSRNLGPSWAHAYHDVTERAVERLADDSAFVSRIAHLPASLYLRSAQTITPKALYPLVEMASNLAYRLMDWETKARLTGLRNAEMPQPTRTDNYGEAWREVVSGWERLLQAIGPRLRMREGSSLDWPEFQRFADNIIAHLRSTTQISARAIWVGDLTATVWTADLMLHWAVQADRAWDTRNGYWRIQKEGFTLTMLEMPWEQVTQLGLAPDDTPPSAAQMLGAIMQNAWSDHLFTLAILALHWSVHGKAPESGPLAARMLLQNKPHDRGDTGLQEDVPFSGTSVLTSILRIRGDGVRWEEQSYAGRFDHLLEELGGFGEAPYVSMRIYSGSGGLSFEALPLASMLAIMATSPEPQGIDGQLRRLLTHGDDASLQRKKRYLEALRDASAEFPFETVPLMAKVCDLDASNFNTRRGHARKLVLDALAILDGHRQQAIIDAQIDAGRIAEVAAAASSEAFTRDHFPLNLFGTIEATPNALAPWTYTTPEISKGSFTNPPMGQIVSNEEDWWRSVTGRKIANEVWLDVLRKAEFKDIEGRTPPQFWRAIKRVAKRIVEAEQNPVIVLANSNFPEWLSDWRWTYREGAEKKPKDLVISTRSDQVESYAFHMNDIPVYEATALYGVAYMFPVELLERARYHDYGDGIAVELEFEADEADPWSGSIKTSFQRNVELGDFEVYRIRFANPIEDLPISD